MTRPSRRRAIAAALSLVAWSLGAPSLRAQDAACRQPELEALAWLAGEWEVAVEVRLSLDGPWEPSAATAEISREMEGCLIVERFVGTLRERPYRSLKILSWNARGGAVQRYFVDSDQVALLMEGRPGATLAEGSPLELFVEREGASGTALLRTVYTRVAADAFTVEFAGSRDGGETWFESGRWRYHRVAPTTGSAGP